MSDSQQGSSAGLTTDFSICENFEQLTAETNKAYVGIAHVMRRLGLPEMDIKHLLRVIQNTNKGFAATYNRLITEGKIPPEKQFRAYPNGVLNIDELLEP